MPPSPPSSLTSSGPGPANDRDLESDLLTHLATTHALEDLHSTLLSTLQRLGWTEKIRRLSTELLRANRCERFDDVVEAVVASAQGRAHPFLRDSEPGGSNSHNSNGNGNGDTEGFEGGSGFSFESADVRIPRVVVEQGVRAIKDVLREVVVLEDDEGDKIGSSARASASGTGSSTGGSSGSGSSGGRSNIAVEVGGEGPTTGTKRASTNGDTSPTKKADKKAKSGKQAK
ncbi:uncharacterized protein BDV17DRAFT_288472 [Aspergillus undulatus]|uniref:uncharacterized protein n=1 Tax=Aspergillus undulatus TaxID=1810928 RepID=UPI003CCD2C54